MNLNQKYYIFRKCHIYIYILFFFQQPLDVTNHSVAREVVTFFTLPPGDYIVVPQTNVPNCDGKFLLRILTDEQSNIWEVNEDNVLFRNVLVEFEESFKYVSFVKPNYDNFSRCSDGVEIVRFLDNRYGYRMMLFTVKHFYFLLDSNLRNNSRCLKVS